MNLPHFRPQFRRRISWTILALAASSFLFLALAEQGTSTRVPGTVPPAPLPFERQRVFGLDLSSRSSVAALTWLRSTTGGMPGLVAIPIDGEVVLALGQEQARPNALAAIDLLVNAARGAPIAACLRKPAQTVGDIGVAQAAVGALAERYPASIAYVSSCERTADPSWQRAVGRAALSNVDPPPGTEDAFFPLTVGTIAHVRSISEDDIGAPGASASGDSRYVLVSVDVREPASATLIQAAADALRNEPALALILLRPEESLDPTTILASIRDVRLSDTTAPQGFSNVGSPPIVQSDEWEESIVGTARYRRTDVVGAAMRVEFSGTQLHLVCVLSPDAGSIVVWLDAVPGAEGASPWIEIDLSADQARDDAIALVEDIPASRHQVTIVSTGGDFAVSGFFAAGKEESGATSALATIGLFLIAVAALADVCYSAVAELRARAGITDRPLRAGEYPR